MILTTEILEQGKSSAGAWSKKQLLCFKVKWPLKKGWKRKIINRDFPEEAINKFLALTDSHLNKNYQSPASDSLFAEFLECTKGI